MGRFVKKCLADDFITLRDRGSPGSFVYLLGVMTGGRAESSPVVFRDHGVTDATPYRSVFRRRDLDVT